MREMRRGRYIQSGLAIAAVLVVVAAFLAAPSVLFKLQDQAILKGDMSRSAPASDIPEGVRGNSFALALYTGLAYYRYAGSWDYSATELPAEMVGAYLDDLWNYGTISQEMHREYSWIVSSSGLGASIGTDDSGQWVYVWPSQDQSATDGFRMTLYVEPYTGKVSGFNFLRVAGAHDTVTLENYLIYAGLDEAGDWIRGSTEDGWHTLYSPSLYLYIRASSQNGEYALFTSILSPQAYENRVAA